MATKLTVDFEFSKKELGQREGITQKEKKQRWGRKANWVD